MKAMEAGHSPSPELSRPFTVARLSTEGEPFRFEANPVELAALAARFDLIELKSLVAEGRISSFDHGHGATVEGIVRADVVQACVVTLEPVPARIEESFVRTYADRPSSQDREAVVDMEADDPPDPLVGGIVDIGEAVAETLGLALDPYPRAPGVGPVVDEAGENVVDVTNPPVKERESPFSALKGLIKKSQ